MPIQESNSQSTVTLTDATLQMLRNVFPHAVRDGFRSYQWLIDGRRFELANTAVENFRLRGTLRAYTGSEVSATWAVDCTNSSHIARVCMDWLRLQCGNNDQFPGVYAWHFGPSDDPLEESGDIYVATVNDANARYAVVRIDAGENIELVRSNNLPAIVATAVIAADGPLCDEELAQIDSWDPHAGRTAPTLVERPDPHALDGAHRQQLRDRGFDVQLPSANRVEIRQGSFSAVLVHAPHAPKVTGGPAWYCTINMREDREVLLRADELAPALAAIHAVAGDALYAEVNTFSRHGFDISITHDAARDCFEWELHGDIDADDDDEATGVENTALDAYRAACAHADQRHCIKVAELAGALMTELENCDERWWHRDWNIASLHADAVGRVRSSQEGA